MENKYFQFSGGRIIARLTRGTVVLADGVDFGIDKGQTMALIGRTGAGKTMTAFEIMGLLPANVFSEDSKIVLDGTRIDKLSKAELTKMLGSEIVYIPQNGSEFLNPSIRIGSQLNDALKKLGIPRKDRRAKAMEKLSLAGFPVPEEILDKYSFQLSGGMAQRVTIALAACSDAKLLIADEPTNGLDSQSRKLFVEVLKSEFPNAAKIVITHDPRLEELCDFTYKIERPQI